MLIRNHSPITPSVLFLSESRKKTRLCFHYSLICIILLLWFGNEVGYLLLSPLNISYSSYCDDIFFSFAGIRNELLPHGNCYSSNEFASHRAYGSFSVSVITIPVAFASSFLISLLLIFLTVFILPFIIVSGFLFVLTFSYKFEYIFVLFHLIMFLTSSYFSFMSNHIYRIPFVISYHTYLHENYGYELDLESSLVSYMSLYSVMLVSHSSVTLLENIFVTYNYFFKVSRTFIKNISRYFEEVRLYGFVVTVSFISCFILSYNNYFTCSIYMFIYMLIVYEIFLLKKCLPYHLCRTWSANNTSLRVII